MQMFRNWKLGAKTIFPTLIVAVIVIAAMALMVRTQQRNMAIDQARRTATTVARQTLAVRKIYTDTVVGKLKKDGVAVAPLDLKSFGSVQGGIPLPASFVHATTEIINQKGGYSVDLLSLWNINPNKGPRNQFEQQSLQGLVNSPQEIKESVIGDGDDAKYFQVLADVASTDACVTCHNGHPSSPKRDFAIGDVMGGVVVSVALGTEFAAVRNNTVTLVALSIGAIALVVGAALLFQWVFVNRPVAIALASLERAADRISTGELDEPVQAQSEDEIGRLAKAFDRMRISLKTAMEHMERG